MSSLTYDPTYTHPYGLYRRNSTSQNILSVPGYSFSHNNGTALVIETSPGDHWYKILPSASSEAVNIVPVTPTQSLVPAMESLSINDRDHLYSTASHSSQTCRVCFDITTGMMIGSTSSTASSSSSRSSSPSSSSSSRRSSKSRGCKDCDRESHHRRSKSSCSSSSSKRITVAGDFWVYPGAGEKGTALHVKASAEGRSAGRCVRKLGRELARAAGRE